MIDLPSYFDGARERGNGQWIAQCSGPLHENGDRSPSLSIKDAGGGRWLLHCFSGCDASDILAAKGLELSDLYPEGAIGEHKGERPKLWAVARDALKALDHECLVVAIVAERIANGQKIPEGDLERLREAARKIRSAARLVA